MEKKERCNCLFGSNSAELGGGGLVCLDRRGYVFSLGDGYEGKAEEIEKTKTLRECGGGLVVVGLIGRVRRSSLADKVHS